MDLNRPLTKDEKKKMHPLERDVVLFYERITKNKFHRQELVTLKQMTQAATPEQIKAVIYRTYKNYPDRFINLAYIGPMVFRFFIGRRGKEK
jgi:hypothetical protein